MSVRPRAALFAASAAVVAAALAPATASAAHGAACDPYASSAKHCLLPFPNDRNLTVHDAHSATKRRVHFVKSAMPRNVHGVSMNPKEWNRNDGFSPGQEIIVKVPGLDTPAALKKTNPVGLSDLSKYTKRTAPVLLLDAKTGKRQLIWVELDSNAKNAKETQLLIHPAKNLLDGHRYVVVLRNLRKGNGKAIAAPKAFASYRAGKKKHDANWKGVAKTLKKGKVALNSKLYLAWDFTVASQKNLTGRMLSIRNNAFMQLGDTNLTDGVVQGHAPTVHVTSVENFTLVQDARIQRKVKGTIEVPCYLDKTGCPPGARFHYSSSKPDALPTQDPGNVQSANFECNIPRSATPANPARVSLYGHGLLGDAGEIDAGNVKDMSQEHDMVFCATNWAGMSEPDVPNALAVLQDIGKMPTIADRLQQGFLNFLYLGREMIHPQGFSSLPAFQTGSASLIDRSHLYYDGNSQGGINGGALTAVGTDFTRSVLGVNGMNYSVLLPRSVDWTQYSKAYYPSYPDTSIQPLGLALIQMLWDRGEADGYANHMTTHPLPGTPKHTVLMQIAFGDHQVSNFTAEAEARTIGAKLRAPALDAGRTNLANPFFGIAKIGSYPYSGSALTVWDSGAGRVQPEPIGNVPPPKGTDPHEDARATKAARTMKSAFLEPNGSVIDTCAGKPCHTDVFDAG